MNVKEDTIIGIVGGMGPQAGLGLFNSILRHTPANIDQQHLSTILMSFPGHIVDRTAFLEGDEPVNPAFAIAAIIRKLESAGATIAGIACNTTYSPSIYNVILDDLDKTGSTIKLLNMPYETCRFIKEAHAGVNRVGVMTTNGTYRSGIYTQLLQRWGYDVVIPDYSFQNEVIHRLIYDREFGLKARPMDVTVEARSLSDKAFRFFKSRKCDLIILGCTDLTPIGNEYSKNDMILVDSTDTLARALVRLALPVQTKASPAF